MPPPLLVSLFRPSALLYPRSVAAADRALPTMPPVRIIKVSEFAGVAVAVVGAWGAQRGGLMGGGIAGAASAGVLGGGK